MAAGGARAAVKVARIGYLVLGPASASSSRVEALRAGLRDLGWVEGKNIVIEFRWADGVQQLPELAIELVRMNVDVIFAPSSTMVAPARQATQTIPIVFANHADPIGTGHVASLSRPGGNITGLSELTTELNAKALEVLKPCREQRGSVTTPSQVPGMQSVARSADRLRAPATGAFYLAGRTLAASSTNTARTVRAMRVMSKRR